MAFVALLTIGSLQSCKDDLADLRSQTKLDVADLQYRIDGLQDQLNRVKLALKDSISAHSDSLRNHRIAIDKLIKDLEGYATITYVDTNLAKAKIALLENDSIIADSLSKAINGAVKRLNTRLDNDELRIDTIDSIMHDQFVQVTAQLHTQKLSIDTIKGTLTEMSKRQDRDSLRIDTLKKEFTKLSVKVDSVFNEVFKEGGLKDQVGTLNSQVALIQQQIDSIDAKFDNLLNRFDQLITGILIQSVKSPVFGDFNLPMIGVRNNMLFNYYGYSTWNKGDIKFPSTVTSYAAKGSADPADANFAGLSIKSIYVHDQYYTDSLHLGDVYVTLNPIGHVFNDKYLTLQNSKGEPLAIEVKVNPSNDLLTFGYNKGTRSTIESGLYKGEVYLDMTTDDLEKVEFKFEEKFISSIKDIVKNPSKHNANDLIKAVYEQLGSKKVAAYALRYDWDVDDPVYDLEAAVNKKSYAVLSQYDLAVVAAQPFGFDVFSPYEDGLTSKRLPIIGHIDNFIAELIDRSLNNFKISTSNIEIQGNKIGFESVKYDTDENHNLIATVKGLTINGNEVNVPVVTDITPETAVKGVTEAIVKAINKEINKGESKTLEAEIRTKIDLVLLEMQNQINDVVDDITVQIKDTFNGIGNDTDKYFDKLNRAAKLYDRFASKVNNFLKNPTAYVQVCAFYDCNSGVGVVSNDIKHPTPVKKTSDSDLLNLYLSSYTAELIAPAYKKIVIMNAIYDLNGNKITKNRGSYNKGPNVRTVLDGGETEAAFRLAEYDKGYIYEFVYQALDYTGHTSTQKFYIQVN